MITNIFIEGDNLDALKLLQETYLGQVKLIYIDPPYNTGSDRIYKDDFVAKEEEYLQRSDQSGDLGERLVVNAESNGRFHSDWLTMMYPRLRLAANLLSDDGALFISIDDHEVDNLSRMCSEILGEDSFLGRLIWKNATDNNPTRIAIEHEYILVFCKQKSAVEAVWKSSVSEIKEILIKKGRDLIDQNLNDDDLKYAYTLWFRNHKTQLWPLDGYKFIDRGGVYAGIRGVHNPGREGYRYDVLHPITGLPCTEPLMGYRFPKATMDRLLAEDRIIFGEDHSKLIELKAYAHEFEDKLSSVIDLDGRSGAYDVRSLFPEHRTAFDNPKPVKLLQRLIDFVLKDDGDIL
jgi:adenine-specific DNA-methyltransferase